MREDFGLMIAQAGTPVNQAADYQKVLDSRWRFVEVEMEIPVNIQLPAAPAVLFAASHNEDTPIVRHALGFLPPFEHNLTVGGVTIDDFSVSIKIWSDGRTVFLRRFISVNPYPAQNVVGLLRIYNLPIVEEFEADKTIISPSAGGAGGQGFRAADGSVPNIGPTDKAALGYSIDTQKKILSIHKHGFADINGWARHSLSVSAINTGTDVLTVAASSSLPGYEADWIATPGNAVTYAPGDFVTYPNPLVAATTYYTIPVDATHIKLAATLVNARAGVAIDLTTAGALPGAVNGVDASAGENARIYHHVGYPPTYLLCPLQKEGASYLIGPFLNLLSARVRATANYIEFRGVQSLFSGIFAYMILKDPAELAL